MTIQARVPGDKSIAHRALMLSMLADGESRIDGLPDGLDVASTAACVAGCGATVERDGASARVVGLGMGGPSGELGSLDCGNSGTTMRLFCGLLAGGSARATLVGDASLSSRPMGRVIEPLGRLGATIESTGGRAPLRISGAALVGCRQELAVASAQVKSAVLLAGLSADGPTTVVEPGPTRDHTERMLAAMGAPVEVDGPAVTVRRCGRLAPLRIEVPGDASSAAFWLALGAFGSRPVTVADVGVNPTRTGALELLEAAGATVTRSAERVVCGEPVATVTVAPIAEPRPLSPDADQVVRAVDEIPLLMLMAALIPGTSRFRHAAELRVKECDRIAAVGAGLRALGVSVVEHEDGMDVTGGLAPADGRVVVPSQHDHRIAIGLSVLAVAAGIGERLAIGDAGAAAVSYPTFYDELAAACPGALPALR